MKCEDLGSRRDFYRRVRVLSPIVVEEELMLVAVQAKVQVVKEVPGVDPRHSLHLESIPKSLISYAFSGLFELTHTSD